MSEEGGVVGVGWGTSMLHRILKAAPLHQQASPIVVYDHVIPN